MNAKCAIIFREAQRAISDDRAASADKPQHEADEASREKGEQVLEGKEHSEILSFSRRQSRWEKVPEGGMRALDEERRALIRRFATPSPTQTWEKGNSEFHQPRFTGRPAAFQASMPPSRI